MSAPCSLFKKLLAAIGFVVWIFLLDSVVRLTIGTETMDISDRTEAELQLLREQQQEYLLREQQQQPSYSQQLLQREREMDQLLALEQKIKRPRKEYGPKPIPVRDPKAPEHSSSPYVHYTKVKHEELELLHPNMPYAERSVLIARSYLEVGPEELHEWEDRAEAHYREEMSRYVPSPRYAPTGMISEPSGDYTPKRQRDPKKPKDGLNPKYLYAEARDQEFKIRYPEMSDIQRGKAIFDKFSDLDPDEKEEWEERAAVDIARYMEELARYVPSPGYDKEGNLLSPNLSPEELELWKKLVEARAARSLGRMAEQYDKTGHLVGELQLGERQPSELQPGAYGPWDREQQKPKRDPKAPKRDSGPYVLFMDAKHKELRLLHPDMSYLQRAKLIAKTYLELLQEESREWEDRAEADRARYADEMTRYVPSPGYDPKGNIVTQIIDRDPEVPRGTTPDPRLLFQATMRHELAILQPQLTFAQQTNLVNKAYSKLGPEGKEEWEERVAAERARYMEEMVRYVPSPGYGRDGRHIDSKVSSPEEKQAWMERVETRVNDELYGYAHMYDKTGHRIESRGPPPDPKRDPKAPMRREERPYQLFKAAKDKEFQLRYPELTSLQREKLMHRTFVEFGPEENKEWEELVAANRARYMDEVASYVPPPGYDRSGYLIRDLPPKLKHFRIERAEADVADLLEGYAKNYDKTGHLIAEEAKYEPRPEPPPKPKPKPKPKRDPKAPRRNSSPYLLFEAAKDQEYQDLYPELTNGQRATLVSTTYAEYGKKEKEELEELAAADLARYMNEMTSYVPSPGFDKEGNQIDPDLSPAETQEWIARIEARVAERMDGYAKTFDETGHLRVPWTPASEETKKPRVEKVLDQDKGDAKTSIE